MADNSDKKNNRKQNRKLSKSYTRRDFLKTAGAAAAFGAASTFGIQHARQKSRSGPTNSLTPNSGNTAPTGAATGGQDYEVIKASAGERKVIRLDDGEVFENVLLDQTASGSAISVVAQGTDWTIRNVGWKGPFSHSDRAIAPGDTGGGTSVIENVYMGDGVDNSVGGTRHPKFGLWVTPEHSGHLEINRMHVAEANDNGFYGSAPGSNGNGQRGTIHYLNSYARDNRVSGFRIARGKVENCVAVNTSSGNNGRPLWVWPTDYHGDPVEVVDCDFLCGSYPHGYDWGRDGRTTEGIVRNTDYAPAGSTRYKGDVNIDETNVGHNPEHRVPEGVPMSAEEAASGTASGGRATEHSITLSSDSGSATYMFKADGRIEAESSLNDRNKIFTNVATGVVESGEEISYTFQQGLISFEADENIDIELNGEQTTIEEVKEFCR